MKFQRQPVEEASVNLTPLIDVVFLLLIFFMVSTTFTRERELTLQLPEAVADSAAETPEFIEIEVSVDGEYAIDQQRLVNRERETLARALREKAQGNLELPLIITADANATHQAVMTAMDVAGELGFTRLRLTAQQPEQ
ncbi:MAG: biopolymer transporter ExbD [Pseudomonadota bacterium]|nr:biopolymer transporter ExbD [Pseudomonadales bacterium]MDY6921689.1 biopolymer transporter ExbD [Pseudomonadota bacterium]